MIDDCCDCDRMLQHCDGDITAGCWAPGSDGEEDDPLGVDRCCFESGGPDRCHCAERDLFGALPDTPETKA